jgi:hypothetical protein
LTFAGTQEFFELACHLLDDVVGNDTRDAVPRKKFREALGSGISLFLGVIFSGVRWEVMAAYVVLSSIVKNVTAGQEDIQRGLLQEG